MHSGFIVVFDMSVDLGSIEGLLDFLEIVGLICSVTVAPVAIVTSVSEVNSVVDSVSVVDFAGLVDSVTVVDSVGVDDSVSGIGCVVVIGISGVDNVTPSGTIGLAGLGNKNELL